MAVDFGILLRENTGTLQAMLSPELCDFVALSIQSS